MEVVDAPPDGGKQADLAGIGSAFAPEYQPQEIFDIAMKLYDQAK